MARRNSQPTGWIYQPRNSQFDTDYKFKQNYTRCVIKVDVPEDDNLLENALLSEEQSHYDQESLSERRQSICPSPSATSPCTVLRELPSRQISFLPYDTEEHTSSRSPTKTRKRGNKHKRQKQAGISSSHAKKAMMTRGRDELNTNEIICSMLSNPQMNQAGLEADYKRMETIKELNCSLTMKRKMKHKIGIEINNQQKPIVVQSPTTMFKIQKVIKNTRVIGKQMCSTLDMWRSQLMQIEGKYGSSTTYYFRFLHFLIILNLVNFIFTSAFVVTPQLLLRFFGQYQPIFSNVSDNLTTIEQTTVLPSATGTLKKRSADTYSLLTDEDQNQTIKFQWTDLITGAGFLSTTELYYGTYTNISISITGNDYYDLPLAYVVVILVCLTMGLIVLVTRVAKAYKQHIVSNSGFGVNIYCNLIFGSWDFKIRSKKAAKLKFTGIRQELEAKLVQLKNEANPMNSREQAKKLTRHLFIHLIVFTILAGTGTLIWFLLEYNSLETNVPILDEMVVPLVITVLLIIIPFTFTLLLRWEKYINGNTAIYVNMIRMMLLLVTVIGVLSRFWFKNNANENSSTPINNCWETRLGEEIYKLLTVDFVVVNTVSIISSFTQKYLLHPCFGFPEFNLAWNTWNLIYTQMLGWLGALYMPPVSGLVIIKLFLTYYIKQVHLRLICMPPARPWGASLTKTVFLSLAFLGLVFMLIPIGYSIFIMRPSHVCGPFKDTNNIYSVLVGVVQAFSMVDGILGFFYRLICMPGFVAALLVILCAVAFQAKSYANCTKQLRERLRRQVILEGNDKVFLLNMLDGATKSLESKRSNQDVNTAFAREVFNYPPPTTNPEIHQSTLSQFERNLTVHFRDNATVSKALEDKEFGSSSTAQSFITCEPTSPVNNISDNSDDSSNQMTNSTIMADI